MGKDYYNILGLTRSAKHLDIQAAYRKIALSFHPLKVTEDEEKLARERFRESAEAYDVLGDRKLYIWFSLIHLHWNIHLNGFLPLNFRKYVK